MYPITRESVMAAISSSVAEKAVCWCDGRKKRRRRILRRLTHLAGGGRVIGGLESGKALAFPLVALCSLWFGLLILNHRGHRVTRGNTGKPKSLDSFDTLRFRPVQSAPIGFVECRRSLPGLRSSSEASL